MPFTAQIFVWAVISSIYIILDHFGLTGRMGLETVSPKIVQT
jgi:hypothetical protein